MYSTVWVPSGEGNLCSADTAEGHTTTLQMVVQWNVQIVIARTEGVYKYYLSKLASGIM